MKKFVICLLIVLLMVSIIGCNQQAEEIIVATTTSTQDSGLLDVLVPIFEKKYGYIVKTIAVGTGQALEMGKMGEADVLLTHAPASELELLEAGDILNYKMVMHNDFVIVGPQDDPAGVNELTTAAEAFRNIAEEQLLFVSRGDDSGTHKKELAIWQKSDVEPGGDWYIETGSGMGQALNVASEKDGYCLTDRGTYLALKHNMHIEILFEGEPDLLNIYHVAQVNPDKSDLINPEGAAAFVEFMIAEDTQAIIGEFGVDKFGSPLFFPDAHKDPSEYGLNY
ncbi:MAG: tungsten ABC transporter substrate-binding protein [Desulfitibacter sp. BRH_c19]|nr:MAG: tungsten ABC transporter substrate-binding protein [Desulfitibacter sp. BRH_c19]